MSKGFAEISIKIPDSLLKRMARDPEYAAAAESPVLTRYGAQMEADVKRLLSIGGYGPLRPAKRKGGRRNIRDYTPSMPGQAPRLRTGALRASMGFNLMRVGEGKLALIVGSTRSGSARDSYTGKVASFSEGVNYSKYLEEIGRPYLTPVVKKYKSALRRDLIAALAAAFRR